MDDTQPIDIRELAVDTRWMQKIHLAVAPLRVLLVLLFAFLVLFQVMSLPGQFAHMAEESPELAYLRWPMTTVAVLELLCVQVVIVCTWKLLTMVKDGRIFSEGSLDGWMRSCGRSSPPGRCYSGCSCTSASTRMIPVYRYC